MLFSNLANLSLKDQTLEYKENTNIEMAVFAMGCFWCSATAFRNGETNDTIPGVISTIVGYSGGAGDKPTYENHEGHREVVQVLFNPSIISYEEILDIFWYNIDPFDEGGQFCDRGKSYLSGIYYTNKEQSNKAYKSKQEKEKLLNKRIFTTIEPLIKFYKAEDYHQNYKINNPIKYKYYIWNCGRERRLNEIWMQIVNKVNMKEKSGHHSNINLLEEA